MYALQFREELEEPTQRELDALIARINNFLLTEHNEDGTHNFASAIQASLTEVIDAYQSSGQWWKTGPWRLDDPTAAEPNVAGAIPPKLATGTYNNYAPDGIDEAVVLELEPDGGNAILTGLRALDGANAKRMLLIRNRDSANTLTLNHEDTASIASFRFDLPDSVNVVLDPGQNVWLYYDPNRNGGRWTAAITAQKAGGITQGVSASGVISSSSGPLLEATLTVTTATLNAMNVTPQTLVAAPGSGLAILPYRLTIHNNCSVSHSSTAGVRVRWAGNTTDGIAITGPVGFNENRYYSASPQVTASLPGTAGAFENVAMEISTDLALTGGSSTVKFSLVYQVVSLA